jgi:hypothetical protein
MEMESAMKIQKRETPQPFKKLQFILSYTHVMVQLFYTAPLFTKEMYYLLKSFYFMLLLFWYLNVRQQAQRSNAKEAIILAPQQLDCQILVKKDELPKGIHKIVSSWSFQYVPWKEPSMASFSAILDVEHLQCLNWCASLHFQHHKANSD